MSTTQELTVTRLKERVARFMGWKRAEDWPAELEIVTVANEAGEWLTSRRPWQWLQRSPVNLALTAGQDFVTLPTDFGRHIAVVGRGTNAYSIRRGDMSEVAAARADIQGAPRTFVYCYGYSGPSVAGPKPDVRMFIGPVPTATIANAFVLTYAAGWKPLVGGGDHVLVPSWMIPLYVRAVCMYVGGLEREIEGTLEDRLDRLEASTLFEAAADRDDTTEEDLGPMRGGVEETLARGGLNLPYGGLYPNPPIVRGS